MALEKYEYPASGTVTASWYPTRNPTYADFSEKTARGILMDESFGDQVYFYKEGPKVKVHTRKADRFVESEWAGYDAFRDAVGGETFKFTDGAGAAHTVNFIPDDDEATISLGDRRSWKYSMREQL